jgi:mannose-1-phosphate guanylyltransferase
MQGGSSDDIWAIVLAAGEGQRLAAITASLHGRPVPKQFASLVGDRSLLQATMDRVAALVPARRTVVVVAEAQAALARQQLRGFAGAQSVVQPSNRGTAVGLMLPLCHVLARDPGARVLVVPSDHVIKDERPFRDAVRRAFRAAAAAPAGVVLAGAEATGPATDLGWIQPGEFRGLDATAGRAVQAFWEKPDEARASALFQQGALWNMLVIAARAADLWKLIARHLPGAAARFVAFRDAPAGLGDRQAIADLYREIGAHDLSREVLERAVGLAVVSMIGGGWTDCGTPDRLLACLGTEARRAFRARLAEAPGAGSSAAKASACD